MRARDRLRRRKVESPRSFRCPRFTDMSKRWTRARFEETWNRALREIAKYFGRKAQLEILRNTIAIHIDSNREVELYLRNVIRTEYIAAIGTAFETDQYVYVPTRGAVIWDRAMIRAKCPRYSRRARYPYKLVLSYPLGGLGDSYILVDAASGFVSGVLGDTINDPEWTALALSGRHVAIGNIWDNMVTVYFELETDAALAKLMFG